MEGTLGGHLNQLPCNRQEHLQLNQAAQSLVQPDIECFQTGPGAQRVKIYAYHSLTELHSHTAPAALCCSSWLLEKTPT